MLAETRLQFVDFHTFMPGLVLAKVGNPSRDEPLQTSKQVLLVEEEDQGMLSSIFY